MVSVPCEWTRRELVKAGAGLTIGVLIGSSASAEPAKPRAAALGDAVPKGSLAPNAFVRVAPDSSVTVIVKHVEMGQGTYTGLPTLVAEELDADWSQIRVEGAPADARRYNNLFWGETQGTGGSTALANSFDQLRVAGATARAMLVSAAAARWSVPAAEIRVRGGVVQHEASGRTAAFGELAEAAAKLPVPTDVKLKDPKDFVYIGKKVTRTDSRAKSTGAALYTQDVDLPGLRTALVAHAPRFGARLRSFDPAQAMKVPGVVRVVQIPTGVAVVGRDFWSAKRGRDALKLDWDESGAFALGSAEILAQFRELAKSPGARARLEGDPVAALAKAPRKLSAEFEFPYLAHACMEPMNCVVHLEDGRCQVWNGEQFQTVDQQNVARVVGLPPEKVTLHMLFAGGSFGRRANPQSDYLVEAAQIAKALNDRAPVKLVWTREDDMRAGYYRPMYLHRLEAGLDERGAPVAWQHRIVGQSILAGTPFESAMVRDGIDGSSVEGASTLPYAIPNLGVDLHSPRLPVPVQWWRSVGSTHTAFATEVFLDELAAAAGKDPAAYRRGLLAKHPRHLATLDLVVEKSGWAKPLPAAAKPERRGRGIAVHESFGTVVAQVADVRVAPDGSFRVERVVCAVDCGIAVNPDVIAAQMESGIGYGLSAALHGAITLKGGAVEQSNFHDYAPLRIAEMPAIEVHIVPSTAKPSGVGEPGTPVIAPAVAAALFAATGKRLRVLPFRSAELKLA